MVRGAFHQTGSTKFSRLSTTNRNDSCTHDQTIKLGLPYAYGANGTNVRAIMELVYYNS
jgi:hypothetical protein